MKTTIKVQDTVSVLTGKNKGKTGKVTQILRKDAAVVIEGVNVMYKNMRPQKRGDKGQRIEFFAPVALSKVMLVCPKCSKPTRVTIKRDGVKRVRECKKCKASID
jgi:large subunit ribosomal protein L24